MENDDIGHKPHRPQTTLAAARTISATRRSRPQVIKNYKKGMKMKCRHVGISATNILELGLLTSRLKMTIKAVPASRP